MGALAKLLDAGTTEVASEAEALELAGGWLTKRIEGDHDADTEEVLLAVLGHDPAAWTFAVTPAVYRKLDESGFLKFTTYRYRLAPRAGMGAILDRILKRTMKPRVGRPATGGAFNFQASDLQLGKSDNGGSELIVERYLDSVQVAVDKLERLRRFATLPIVHVMFPGDCIEGNQSQNGRNMWRTDLTVTEQTRVFRHLMYKTIEVFAPLADSVLVDVVNGNHDEVQRFQTTRPDDGHATESAIAVREGLALNEAAFGHVEVRVPPLDQGHMTVPVGDTVFTIAHGHQWRRGRAMEWWSGQTFYRHAAGAATVLAHGHFHEVGLERQGDRVSICSPTYDQGSNYFREMRGAVSPPGGLAYVTDAGKFSDLTIV
ncbi:nuclease [Gordonia phage Dardanus]|uniref:Nuclease n=1 Tax=Gordonia phage Dardanus TaxID=2588489 RepID=A0A514CX46_9CAUD|nr:exonuclease [Gordonia phage Dardanus]QDH85097.1 nuclease [Gordonia phage Dardanus]